MMTITVVQLDLSHDVAVIQWIASCHKNRMTTRVVTLWRVYVTSLLSSHICLYNIIANSIP